MQNDMLKNTIAPWQEKGRWYHLTVKCESGVLSVLQEETDDRLLNITFSTNLFTFPIVDDDFLIDFEMIIRKGATITNNVTYNKSMRKSPVNHTIIYGSNFTNITEGIIDFYIFLTK